MNERDVARAILRKRHPITLDEARDALTWFGSYTRLPMIIKLHVRRGLSRADTLTLIGEKWSGCDANGRACGELLAILLPDCAAPEMMTDAERAHLTSLPEHVTIYRGADRGVNERGFCWSLNRDVAARFPFFVRYDAARPVLVTATVDRSRITAVKLDREEMEIVTRPDSPRIESVDPIHPPPEHRPEP